MNKELIDAIRTGTAMGITVQLARLPCFQGGFDAEHITAEAIVAARAKPEDVAIAWMPWHDDGLNLPHFGITEKDAVDRCVQTGYPHNEVCKVRIIREPKK